MSAAPERTHQLQSSSIWHGVGKSDGKFDQLRQRLNTLVLLPFQLLHFTLGMVGETAQAVLKQKSKISKSNTSK